MTTKTYKRGDVFRFRDSGDAYMYIHKERDVKNLIRFLNLDKGWFIHDYISNWYDDTPRYDKVKLNTLSNDARAMREYYLEHDHLCGFKVNK